MTYHRAAILIAATVHSAAFALEGPTFNVGIETNILYTATPASSSVPGFKPHINFPWLVKRGDGSLVTWWSVGQTHGAGGFGLGAVSNDGGTTWSTPSSTIPFVPAISQMLPAGQFSRGFQIDYTAPTSAGGNSWTQSRFLSTNGGVSWTTQVATFSTGATNYVSMYQNPGAVIADGNLLLVNAFGQRPGESTFETVLFASTNGGQTWNKRSVVATHIPGPNANMGEEGPNESDIIRLNNGNLLAVYRTGQPFPNADNNAVSPSIFSSISTDMGQTWSAPKMLGVMGAFPHLNKLDDGSVAMTYGRHGAKIMFADATGTRWSFPTTILSESSSGYVRMERRNDGRWTYNYDHSSFYPPSWDGSVPPGYVYANDQMAHMKSSILTITKQNIRDDFHWAHEYHGDVTPAAAGWNENPSGSVSGYLWGDLGQDYFRSDTGVSGTNRSYYSELPGAGANAWTAMDFAEGVVIDVRARAGSAATAESAADIFAGDQSNGYVALQLTGSAVFLEGLNGNAGQVTYAPVGFSPQDWHDYRIVIEPDPTAGGAIRAKVYLDKNYTTPILVNALSPAVADSIRFGDGTGLNNGILDLDFLRFSAINGEWDFDGNGAWSDFDRWSTTIPSGVDRRANFLDGITSPRTVDVDGGYVVGHLRFDNASRYTLGGAGSLTLQVSGGKASVTLTSGNHTIGVPLNLVSNTDIAGTGTLTTSNITNAGSLSIQANLIAGSIDGIGTTTVAAGKLLRASRVRQSAMVVNGNVEISPGRSTSKTSVVTSLQLGGGALLDLGDNDLIVNYAGVSPLMSLREKILSGAIVSSVAANDPTRALGYGDTAVLGAGEYSGQNLDGSAVVIRYTAHGDTDLNGIVDSIDFTRFLGGYGVSSNALWTQGDFSHDGKVTSLDFNLLSGNFGVVVTTPMLGVLVPEPASAAAMMLMGILLRRVRQR